MKELHLSENPIQDAGLEALARQYDAICTVSRLYLRNCQIRDPTPLFTSSAQYNPALRLLDLSENFLDCPEFGSITTFLHRQKFIEQLIFQKCQLKKRALKAIGEGLLRNTTLRSLQLQDNEFPHDSHTFELGRGCATVRSLSLEGNLMLQDQAVISLVQGLQSANEISLQTLDLRSLQIGDKSAELILDLLKKHPCHSVSTVNVEGTLIKKHYQDLLKETLQKCKARNIKKAVPQAYLELDSLNKLTRNGQVCSFSNRNSL